MLKCRITRTISPASIFDLCSSKMWYDAASVEECVELFKWCYDCKNLDEDSIIRLAENVIEHSVDLDDSDLKYVAESIFISATEKIEFYDE